MKPLLLLAFISIAVIGSSCNNMLKSKYVWTPSSQQTPPAPDYSNTDYWAALPNKEDLADHVPSASIGFNNQEHAGVDIFFIHPTSYLQPTHLSTGWNANINDEKINHQTDQGSIKYQASVFNQAGKIYAPRYRQACISAYHLDDTLNKKRALDIAYLDVKSAFDYYMSHWNQGRPVIIASHSQGSTHAIRLLQDYFDHDDAMAEKLVAAYLVGMSVWDTMFVHLRPCGDADDTRCFTTWCTYAKGYFPKNYVKPYREPVCTNPLTWKTDASYAPRSSNNGSVLKNFNKVYTHVCDAQVLDGVVRISRPRFPGSFLYHLKNYHIVDYNLFYLSIRENSLLRTRMFQDVQPGK